MALFILWGKNQVCFLDEASTNNVLDNSDIGIKVYAATRAEIANKIQNNIFPFPSGFGKILGIGFLFVQRKEYLALIVLMEST